MKNRTSKLFAILVSGLLVLTLSAVFAIVASAWTGTYMGDGYLIDTIEDGNGGIYAKVTLDPDYMIDDKDLHDGIWDPTAKLQLTHVNNNGSTSKTEVTAKATYDGEEVFWIPVFDEDKDSLAITNISKIDILIDETFTEDAIFEPNGHKITFKGANITGHVVVLNTKNDFTRVMYDGAAVDANGKIAEYDSKNYKSRWPDVHAEVSFVNHGTLEFLTAKNVDAATMGEAIEFAYDFSKKDSFVNFGTINVEANVIFALTGDRTSFYNAEGATIKVGHNVYANKDAEGCLTIITPQDTDALSNGLESLTNDGEIICDRGQLILGDGRVCSNLLNNGYIKTNSLLKVFGALKNTKAGVIELVDTKWINCCTGVTHYGYVDTQADYSEYNGENRMRAIARLILPTKYINGAYAQHVNSGKIFYDGDYIYWSAQSWELASGLDITDNLMFRNSGNFSNRGYFSIKTTYTPAQDQESGSWETMVGSCYNDGVIYNADGAIFEIIGTKLNFFHAPEVFYLATGAVGYVVAPSDPALGAMFARPVAIDTPDVKYGGLLYPCEIINDGTMVLPDVKSAGYIENNGDLTIKGVLEAIYADAFDFIPNGGLVFDNCPDCKGHPADITLQLVNSDVVNNGNMVTELAASVYMFENNGTYLNKLSFLVNDTAVNNGIWNNGIGAKITVDGKLINNGSIDEVKVANNGMILNKGDFDISTIENNGRFEEAGNLNVSKSFDNEDYLLITGKYVNNGELVNGFGCDIRVEGELDNVNGFITNDGMIVNVGTITSLAEGIDNRFAIHGYDVTYVVLADEDDTDAPATDAPATDAPATDAPANETKAPDTQKKSDIPAAQTSDIAVAGFAVLATLALAGVVVAKKVR